MSDLTPMTAEELAIMKEHGINHHNFIVIRDADTKEILRVEKNLVVRTGREFDLRKIFGLPYNGETVATLNTRTLCLFGIGSGGTPVGNPFSPIPPTAADTDLNSKVAFRTVTASSPLSSQDQLRYADAVANGAETNYYKKTFNSTPTLTVDPARDQVFVKVPLSISNQDARNALISELALYSANQPSANNYNGYKMFSRITFQTEPLSAATGKALDIDYYVYA